MTQAIETLHTRWEIIRRNPYGDRPSDYHQFYGELKSACETQDHCDADQNKLKTLKDAVAKCMKPTLGFPGGSTARQ